MKNSKKILSAALLTTLLISPCFATNQLMEDQQESNGNKKTNLVLQKTEEFKGNWTETFILKDGSSIVHTPERVSMGFMSSGGVLTLRSKSYNNIPMSTEGLVVKRNSTREEFIEALIKSGLYNSK